MNAINAANTTEPDLQTLIYAVAALACQRAQTSELKSIVADPAQRTRALHVTTGLSGGRRASGALHAASSNRLACLCRHWTWANEAMERFEQELAQGWEYDDDLLADHPFGAYYHWCALLCGFSEAALEYGLLSDVQLERLRSDLEASLPDLRACRQLLVVIPESLEEQPHIVDLLRNDETLDRLRRLQSAFGEALREEQRSRDLEWLLYEY